MLVKLESSIPFKTHTLSRKELTSLVDSYLSKDEEFRSSLTTPPVNYTRLCQTTLACVKLICERLGFFEPVCISEAVYNLKRVCKYAQDRDSLSANIAVDVSSSYHNVLLQIILFSHTPSHIISPTSLTYVTLGVTPLLSLFR